MKKILLCVAVASLLGGCATMLEPQTVQDATSQVVVTNDSYKGTKTHRGALITLKNPTFSDSSLMMGFLRRTSTDTDQAYCLYAIYNNKNWAFFDSAYDADQKELKVVKIDSQIEIGGIQEDICITMTKPYLEGARSKGLDIKLVGKNTELVVKVPAHYVEGFMQAVEAK